MKHPFAGQNIQHPNLITSPVNKSNFKKELITINHIGYKFGEFAPTRKNGKKKNG